MPLKKLVTKNSSSGSGEPTSRRPRPDLINTPAFEREIQYLTVDQIKPHPRNPNVGDVDAIVESIEELGLYDPLIWNRRNGKLVAGHHTWLAMRRKGWTEFPAVVVDVDEETHVRMMLGHNSIAAKGRRDDRALADLLRELDEAGATRGTGYSPADVRRLVDQTDRDIEAAKKRIAETDELATKSLESIQTTATEDPSLDTNDFDSMPDDLPGLFILRDDVAFPGVGEWDIPELLEDMIPTYEEMPKDIVAWAGSATREWPNPDQWWLYTVKVDSTSGINDLSKVIPCFYHYDEYTEVWWQNMSKYTARMLYSGIGYAVSPDFSPHVVGQEARFGSLMSLYKNRWMARYMQQAGIKVLPNVNWSTLDEKFLVEHTLPTLPANPSMIAIQIQTAFAESRDKAEVAKHAKEFGRLNQVVFDTLKPGGALIYYGKVGREAFEQHVNPGCDIIWVEGRTNRLGDKGKRNMKRKTL